VVINADRDQLVDLTADPYEQENLHGNPAYKPIIARLKPFVPEESKPFASGSKGMGSPHFPGN
jgi:hypothetical protein